MLAKTDHYSTFSGMLARTREVPSSAGFRYGVEGVRSLIPSRRASAR